MRGAADGTGAWEGFCLRRGRVRGSPGDARSRFRGAICIAIDVRLTNAFRVARAMVMLGVVRSLFARFRG